MMRRGDLVRRLTEQDEWSESIPGLPLIEITDDRRVLIERHQGVVGYGCGEICVRVRYGMVRVTGNGLRLARMTAEQLVICGRIDGVHLIRKGR